MCSLLRSRAYPGNAGVVHSLLRGVADANKTRLTHLNESFALTCFPNMFILTFLTRFSYIKTRNETWVVVPVFERSYWPLLRHSIEACGVSAIERRVNKEVSAFILYSTAIRNSIYALISFLSFIRLYNFLVFPGRSHTAVANLSDLELKLKSTALPRTQMAKCADFHLMLL